VVWLLLLLLVVLFLLFWGLFCWVCEGRPSPIPAVWGLISCPGLGAAAVSTLRGGHGRRRQRRQPGGAGCASPLTAVCSSALLAPSRRDAAARPELAEQTGRGARPPLDDRPPGRRPTAALPAAQTPLACCPSHRACSTSGADLGIIVDTDVDRSGIVDSMVGARICGRVKLCTCACVNHNHLHRCWA
jgi:hypothetical protein